MFGILGVVLTNLSGCVAINGQITRGDKQEKYAGLVPWPGFGDQPTVVMPPYPYYRYYSGHYYHYRGSSYRYYRPSHTGYGGYQWNGCKVVRGSHYPEPQPRTTVIKKLEVRFNKDD